jgi:hypothetical protein
LEEPRFLFRSSNGGEPSEDDAAKQIVAHAVLGLLQEDTAIELSTIPTPMELDSEPEIAKIFRDLINEQATPFVSAAQHEYAECANRSYRAGEPFASLARFCHARFDRLSAPR